MTDKPKRKIVAPFDITKLERCPYCGSTDIDNDSEKASFMKCNNCDENWLSFS